MFEPLKSAFQLDGDGPRFMQEFALRPSGQGSERRDVRALLIESPGKATLDENRDHFVKRAAVEVMCLRCSAVALFTLQTHAPNGGRGHVPSLRKGGAITTLVKFTEAGAGLTVSLWRDIACNVLDVPFLKSMCNAAKVEPKYTFPWMAPLESLQSLGGQTWPQDVHPCHMFWAMPRRVRLDFDRVGSGSCDICGEEHAALVSQYFTFPNGLNYNGESRAQKADRKDVRASARLERTTFPNWSHPFSPYVKQSVKAIPVSLDTGGLTYRHWLGWSLGCKRAGHEVLPAAAVHAFHSSRVQPGQVRLWAFGYDVDSMKARCWYETTFPLFDLASGTNAPADLAEVIQGIVEPLVAAAEEVAGYLCDAVRDAWFRKDQVRRDFTFVNAAFWNRTEQKFFALVEKAIDLCRSDSSTAFDQSEPLRREWLDALRRTALALFDEIAGSGRVEAGNPLRLAAAHRALCDHLVLLQGVKVPLDESTGGATAKSGAVTRIPARKLREAT